MKHELLAAAITGIDDALLDDAQLALAAQRPRSVDWRRWCAAAACLAVLVSALLALPLRPGVQISMNGAAVGAAPLLVAAAQDPRMARTRDAAEALEVPLTLAVRRSTVVSVSAGRIERVDGDAEGGGTGACTVRGQATIRWVLPEPNPKMRYALRIHDRVLLLAYDTALQGWTIYESNESKGEKS